MRTATVALVIGYKRFEDSKELPYVLEVLSDDREIGVMEASIGSKSSDPLQTVYDYRQQQKSEEEAFADYVEDLLSQPCLKLDIQQHGVQWLKSKLRIERFQQSEQDAARIIAEYAFQIFRESPEKTEFYLAGATARVRIRVFEVRNSSSLPKKSTEAA